MQLHLDNSSNHSKMPADALVADRLNITPGRLRTLMPGGPKMETKMRDGYWNGNVFKVMEDGKTIGLKEALLRRGFGERMSKEKWTREDMVQELSSHADFVAAASRTELVELVESLSGGRARVVMLPKFHCELNPAELVWGLVKRSLRVGRSTMKKDWLQSELDRRFNGKCDDSKVGPTAYIVGRFADHTRRYLDAYNEGTAADDVFRMVANRARKAVSSHQRAPESVEVLDGLVDDAGAYGNGDDRSSSDESYTVRDMSASQ
jgi:transposase